MAFCKYCGRKIEDGETICSECRRKYEDRGKSHAELVERLKNGDPDAFSDLYEATRASALAAIRMQDKGKQTDHEDILQETYLEVYKHIDQLKDPRTLQKWINMIAVRKVNRMLEPLIKRDQALKDSGIELVEMDREDVDIQIEDVDIRFNPAAIADKKAVAQVVKEIMDELPVDQRNALWMVYGLGMKISEIAESLGVTENTIKSRLFQGRKKLEARKDEFKKRGVELALIPIAALIAMTFETETSYAAGTALIGTLAAGASGVGSAATTTGAGTAAAGAVSSGTAAGSAASASGAGSAAASGGGLSLKVKAAIVGITSLGVVTGAAAYLAANRNPYDNALNKKAVSELRMELKNSSTYKPSVLLGKQLDPAEFGVVDINGDGVWEVLIRARRLFGEGVNGMLLYYDGKEVKSEFLGEMTEFCIPKERDGSFCTKKYSGWNNENMIQEFYFNGSALDWGERIEYSNFTYQSSVVGEFQDRVNRTGELELIEINNENLVKMLSSCGKESKINEK